MKPSIYLDNNATTKIDDRVLEAMSIAYKYPYNPSSVHTLGKKAKMLLTTARESVANYFKVPKDTIYFTPSGTISVNLLIEGFLPESGEILTTEIEHSCIHEKIKSLSSNSKLKASYVPVDGSGAPSPCHIKEKITSATKLMIFSAVYSETGAMLDLEAVSSVAKEYGIPLIVDGVALLGKESVELFDGISAMAFSSHKIHGPKGAGLIYLRDKSLFKPSIFGGFQEMGVAPGTENLEAILGMTKAIELLSDELPSSKKRMEQLRDHFENRILKELPFCEINGLSTRICNVSNIAFLGLDAEDLLIQLDMAGIYCSMGSACASYLLEPSRALLNMGYSSKRALSSIRFSLSRYTTKEEIEKASDLIIEIANAQNALFAKN